MSSALYSLGRFAAHARRRVLVLWLLIVLLFAGLAAAVGDGLSDAIEIPGTESQEALDTLGLTFPEVSGASAQLIVVAAPGDDVRSDDYRAVIDMAVSEFETVDQVDAVISPYDELVVGSINEESGAALVMIQFDTSIDQVTASNTEAVQDIAADVADALPSGAESSLGGQLFSIEIPGVTVVELVGLLIALIVLLATLGSLMAAGMPLLVAIVGVATSTGLIFAATGLTEIISATPVLSLMLGLAVGIDYSLFILSRHRELLRDGLDVAESIGRSVATSGSAVVFAGITVMVALLGLSVAGVPFLTKMGAAAALAVGMAVVTALTLLPALMSMAGERLRPRQGSAKRRRIIPEGFAEGTFRRWIRTVTRFPAVTIAVIVLGLGSMIIPALALNLALPDAGSLPEGSQGRTTYDLVTENFGEGYNATLLVTASVVQSNDPVTLMNDLADDISELDGVALVPLATPNPTGDIGIVQIIPVEGPIAPETEALVQELRAMSGHFADEYGVDIRVTGMTAVAIDVSDILGSALLPFGVLVVGMSLVLLTLVFRSIWIPIKATLGYVLSVSAGLGAVHLVFERGMLADQLHVASVGPVMSFVPILVMGVLFGLAMDYELFLVSRMREEYVHGKDARAAIEHGFMGSARVVTAAALIMFGVFVAFVPEGDSTVKPIALALAVGVFVDAFIVRMALGPAVMWLLGDRAWWMPAWLESRLPVLDVEGEALSHELELRDWATDDNTAITAEGVRVITESSRTAELSLVVPVGGIIRIVDPEAVAVSSALLAVTGRLSTGHARVRSLGRVLPTYASAVRRRSVYLNIDVLDDPISAIEEAIASRTALVAIDGIDKLSLSDHEHLDSLISNSPRDVTILLGSVAEAATTDWPTVTLTETSTPLNLNV